MRMARSLPHQGVAVTLRPAHASRPYRNPAFEKDRHSQKLGLRSILISLAKDPKETFSVFVVQMNGIQYYLWLIFLPTYANLIGGLDRSTGFAGKIAATAAYCTGVPVLAYLLDRIGRKPFLIGSAACFLAFTYPFLSMFVRNPRFGTFLFVAVVGVLFIALDNSVIGTVFASIRAFLHRIMPTVSTKSAR